MCIPVIGQVDLWTETQDLAIENDSTAVKPAASVHYWKSHIDQNTVERGIGQDAKKHVHGVVIDIRFKEVVQTVA